LLVLLQLLQIRDTNKLQLLQIRDTTRRSRIVIYALKVHKRGGCLFLSLSPFFVQLSLAVPSLEFFRVLTAELQGGELLSSQVENKSE
jgi:hypothetical protein